MKKLNIKWAVFATIGSMALFSSCNPEQGKHGLGSLPNPQFTAAVNSNGYEVVAVSSTKSVITYWAIPALNIDFSQPGDSLKVKFPFPGSYRIRMMAAGHGGTDTTSQVVTTTVPDPDACKATTALGFIASCTQKVWKLLPDAGAYKVGPSGPNDGSWWTNGAGDVTARSCEFDDEYTFVFGSAHTFIYNSHGDFYDDGYMGNQTSSCEPESNYTTTQAPWGSGTFTYSVIEGTGVNKLGQLKVIGLGAHMGLQKVTTSGENTSGPVSAITYDIISRDPNGNILVIGVNLGYGWWTFTFQAE